MINIITHHYITFQMTSGFQVLKNINKTIMTYFNYLHMINIITHSSSQVHGLYSSTVFLEEFPHSLPVMITAPPSFGTVLSGFLTQRKCAPAFLLLLSPFVALSLEHPPLGTCLLSGHRSRCINLSLGGQYLRFVTLPRRGSSVTRCRNFPGRETCPLLELENEHPTTGRLYKDTYPY